MSDRGNMGFQGRGGGSPRTDICPFMSVTCTWKCVLPAPMRRQWSLPSTPSITYEVVGHGPGSIRVRKKSGMDLPLAVAGLTGLSKARAISLR